MYEGAVPPCEGPCWYPTCFESGGRTREQLREDARRWALEDAAEYAAAGEDDLAVERLAIFDAWGVA